MPSEHLELLAKLYLDKAHLANQVAAGINSKKYAVNADIKFSGQPLGRIKGQLGEFEKSLEASNARVLAFGASAGVIYALNTALKATVRAGIEVEKQLADINVILGQSAKGLENFGRNLFDIASKTGQTFSVAAKAAQELSRQGLSVEQTLKRTSDALVLARISGLSVESAVSSITAALNSFNTTVIDSTRLVNQLAAVDAKYAVSSGDLAEALKRVGSTANDAGVSLEELIALVTAAQQITSRGGAVIGNSFKSIFTRIQRPRVLDELAGLGISVKDAAGNVKPIINILSDLANKFDGLSAAQRSYISELVGGVYQINILKATLGDLSKGYSIYAGALYEANNATDEAVRRSEELNKTLSARLNKTLNDLTAAGANLSRLTFEPAIKKILSTLSNIAEDSDGASVGEAIAQSIFAGIGKVLSGPGLTFGTLIIGRLINNFGKFLKDSLQTVAGFGSAQKEQLEIGKTFLAFVEQRNKLAEKEGTAKKNLIDLEKDFIREVITGNKQLQERNNLVKAYGASIYYTGARQVSGKASENYYLGLKFPKTKSAGHIPEALETMGALAGGYKPGRIVRDTVEGRPIIRNTAEKVIPFGNSKFIIPPAGSKARREYDKKLERKGIDKSIFYASGFIPNLAGGKFDFPTLQDALLALAEKNPAGFTENRILDLVRSGRFSEEDIAKIRAKFEANKTQRIAVANKGSKERAELDAKIRAQKPSALYLTAQTGVGEFIDRSKQTLGKSFGLKEQHAKNLQASIRSGISQIISSASRSIFGVDAPSGVHKLDKSGYGVIEGRIFETIVNNFLGIAGAGTASKDIMASEVPQEKLRALAQFFEGNPDIAVGADLKASQKEAKRSFKKGQYEKGNKQDEIRRIYARSKRPLPSPRFIGRIHEALTLASLQNINNPQDLLKKLKEKERKYASDGFVPNLAGLGSNLLSAIRQITSENINIRPEGSFISEELGGKRVRGLAYGAGKGITIAGKKNVPMAMHEFGHNLIDKLGLRGDISAISSGKIDEVLKRPDFAQHLSGKMGSGAYKLSQLLEEEIVSFNGIDRAMPTTRRSMLGAFGLSSTAISKIARISKILEKRSKARLLSDGLIPNLAKIFAVHGTNREHLRDIQSKGLQPRLQKTLEQYPQNKQLEEIFEQVRAEQFPHLPSRLNSVFLSPSNNKFRDGDGNIDIKAVPNKGSIIADMDIFSSAASRFGRNRDVNEAKSFAKAYWKYSAPYSRKNLRRSGAGKDLGIYFPEILSGGTIQPNRLKALSDGLIPNLAGFPRNGQIWQLKSANKLVRIVSQLPKNKFLVKHHDLFEKIVSAADLEPATFPQVQSYHTYRTAGGQFSKLGQVFKDKNFKADGFLPNLAPYSIWARNRQYAPKPTFMGSGRFGRFDNLHTTVGGIPIGIKSALGEGRGSMGREHEMSKLLENTKINPLFNVPKIFGSTTSATKNDAVIKEVISGLSASEVIHNKSRNSYGANLFVTALANVARKDLANSGIKAVDLVENPNNLIINNAGTSIIKKIASTKGGGKLAQLLLQQMEKGDITQATRIANNMAKKGARFSIIDPGNFEKLYNGFVPNLAEVGKRSGSRLALDENGKLKVDVLGRSTNINPLMELLPLLLSGKIKSIHAGAIVSARVPHIITGLAKMLPRLRKDNPEIPTKIPISGDILPATILRDVKFNRLRQGRRNIFHDPSALSRKDVRKFTTAMREMMARSQEYYQVNPKQRTGDFISLEHVYPEGISHGHIPNLAPDPILDAFKREKDAGYTPRLGHDNRVGLLVYGKEQGSARGAVNEHLAMGQSLSEIKKAGKSQGHIPNLALEEGGAGFDVMSGLGMMFAQMAGTSKTTKLVTELETQIIRLSTAKEKLTVALQKGADKQKSLTLVDNKLKDATEKKQKLVLESAGRDQTRTRALGVAFGAPAIAGVAQSLSASAGVGPKVSESFAALGNAAGTAANILYAFPGPMGKAASAIVGLTVGASQLYKIFINKGDALGKKIEEQSSALQQATESTHNFAQIFDKLTAAYNNTATTSETIVKLHQQYIQALSEVPAEYRLLVASAVDAAGAQREMARVTEIEAKKIKASKTGFDLTSRIDKSSGLFFDTNIFGKGKRGERAIESTAKDFISSSLNRPAFTQRVATSPLTSPEDLANLAENARLAGELSDDAADALLRLANEAAGVQGAFDTSAKETGKFVQSLQAQAKQLALLERREAALKPVREKQVQYINELRRQADIANAAVADLTRQLAALGLRASAFINARRELSNTRVNNLATSQTALIENMASAFSETLSEKARVSLESSLGIFKVQQAGAANFKDINQNAIQKMFDAAFKGLEAAKVATSEGNVRNPEKDRRLVDTQIALTQLLSTTTNPEDASRAISQIINQNKDLFGDKIIEVNRSNEEIKDELIINRAKAHEDFLTQIKNQLQANEIARQQLRANQNAKIFGGGQGTLDTSSIKDALSSVIKGAGLLSGKNNNLFKARGAIDLFTGLKDMGFDVGGGGAQSLKSLAIEGRAREIQANAVNVRDFLQLRAGQAQDPRARAGLASAAASVQEFTGERAFEAAKEQMDRIFATEDMPQNIAKQLRVLQDIYQLISADVVKALTSGAEAQNTIGSFNPASIASGVGGIISLRAAYEKSGKSIETRIENANKAFQQYNQKLLSAADSTAASTKKSVEISQSGNSHSTHDHHVEALLKAGIPVHIVSGIEGARQRGGVSTAAMSTAPSLPTPQQANNATVASDGFAGGSKGKGIAGQIATGVGLFLAAKFLGPRAVRLGGGISAGAAGAFKSGAAAFNAAKASGAGNISSLIKTVAPKITTETLRKSMPTFARGIDATGSALKTVGAIGGPKLPIKQSAMIRPTRGIASGISQIGDFLQKSAPSKTTELTYKTSRLGQLVPEWLTKSGNANLYKRGQLAAQKLGLDPRVIKSARQAAPLLESLREGKAFKYSASGKSLFEGVERVGQVGATKTLTVQNSLATRIASGALTRSGAGVSRVGRFLSKAPRLTNIGAIAGAFGLDYLADKARPGSAKNYAYEGGSAALSLAGGPLGLAAYAAGKTTELSSQTRANQEAVAGSTAFDFANKGPAGREASIARKIQGGGISKDIQAKLQREAKLREEIRNIGQEATFGGGLTEKQIQTRKKYAAEANQLRDETSKAMQLQSAVDYTTSLQTKFNTPKGFTQSPMGQLAPATNIAAPGSDLFKARVAHNQEVVNKMNAERESKIPGTQAFYDKRRQTYDESQRQLAPGVYARQDLSWLRNMSPQATKRYLGEDKPDKYRGLSYEQRVRKQAAEGKQAAAAVPPPTQEQGQGGDDKLVQALTTALNNVFKSGDGAATSQVNIAWPKLDVQVGGSVEMDGKPSGELAQLITNRVFQALGRPDLIKPIRTEPGKTK